METLTLNNNSRHTRFANDSAILCVVIPKSTKEKLCSLCKNSNVSISSVVRKYVAAGIKRDCGGINASKPKQ